MQTRVLWGGAPAGAPGASRDAAPAPGAALADDPARKLIGRVLDDRFEIVELLGRGGMGVVFGATDHVLERDVVVKVIAPAGAASTIASGERLVREARLACRVQHPAIVAVFHLGVLETGEPYLVMERLRGRDLADVLVERQRMSLDEVIGVLGPIADALEDLHAHGIVHRDLKPANVFLLGGRWELPRVKLIDFGLALLDDETSQKLTRAGQIIGTPEYAPPEAVKGVKAAPSADTYSLATIAFELLAGARPFPQTGLDLLVAKSKDDPRTLSAATGLRRHAPLDPILARALSRDPSVRPTPGELLRQLREARVVDQTAQVRVPRAEEAPAPAPATSHATVIAWIGLATGILALLTALAT